MRTICFLILLGVLLTLPGRLLAQTTAATNPDPVADQAWSDLNSRAFDRSSGVVAKGVSLAQTSATLKADSAARLTAKLSVADQAKAFYGRYPKHKYAVAARKIEILALLDADMAGGAASVARLQQVAGPFQQDTAVAEAERAEIAGFYGFEQLDKSGKTLATDGAAFEQVAKDLVAQFPKQPQGYLSLLFFARSQGDQKLQAVANQVLAAPIPPEFKILAQRALTQTGLTGRKLSEVWPSAVSNPGSPAVGKPTVIYAWMSADANSVDLAQSLAGYHVAAANWIGVNLDPVAQQEAARQVATAGNFPGLQVYDASGPNGALAVALGIDSTPLVILVDKQGVITDIHGIGDLARKLSNLGL